MSTLDDFILNTDRIAPRADDNIQLRRALYHAAKAAQILEGGVTVAGGTFTVDGSVQSEGVVDDGAVFGTTKPIACGGRAVDVTALPAAETAGDLIAVAVDKDTRSLLSNIRTLTAAQDTVSVRGLEPSVARSTAAENSRVVTTSPCRLLYAHISSASGGVLWAQIFNATSLPADGAIPILSTRLAAASSGAIELPLYGMPLSTGLVIAVSSTQNTLTVDAGGTTLFSVLYI